MTSFLAANSCCSLISVCCVCFCWVVVVAACFQFPINLGSVSCVQAMALPRARTALLSSSGAVISAASRLSPLSLLAQRYSLWVVFFFVCLFVCTSAFVGGVAFLTLLLFAGLSILLLGVGISPVRNSSMVFKSCLGRSRSAGTSASSPRASSSNEPKALTL